VQSHIFEDRRGRVIFVIPSLALMGSTLGSMCIFIRGSRR